MNKTTNPPGRTNQMILLLTLLMGMAGACGSDDDSDKSALGTECTKYYGSGGCCLEVAGSVQTAKEACATSKKSIEDSLSKGADKAKTEAACKVLNDLALQQGNCTGVDPCETTCKEIFDCALEDDGSGGSKQNCPGYSASQKTQFIGDKSKGCIAWCKQDSSIKSTVDGASDCSTTITLLKAIDADFADTCDGI